MDWYIITVSDGRLILRYILFKIVVIDMVGFYY